MATKKKLLSLTFADLLKQETSWWTLATLAIVYVLWSGLAGALVMVLRHGWPLSVSGWRVVGGLMIGAVLWHGTLAVIKLRQLRQRKEH